MSPHRSAPTAVAVVDAAGAAAADARAIAAGTPSRVLMQRAGAAAAALIAEHFSDRIANGVVIATGGGNNGGDGWVVARTLHASGISVRVAECVPAKSPDAVAERASAIAAGVDISSGPDGLLTDGAGIVIDALLGTGTQAGAPLRGEVGRAVANMKQLRERGAAIVALDLPSGVDASMGRDAGAVRADLTITFGTVKRGHLVARGMCGRIVMVDIGLVGQSAGEVTSWLASDAWFRWALPAIDASAHKGTRGKVAIVGGASGMGGAVVLAARGALRSGAGMVKCVTSAESLATVQVAEPAALTAEWPTDVASMRATIGDWADVVLIGPGLGRDGAREMVERVLAGFNGPVVLDADALFAFSGSAADLHSLLNGRQALLTPHALEFARLADVSVDQVLDARFELPSQLAARTGAAVLLKGVPTIVASVSGDVCCVAEGTPILATGGSGDVLGGIAATLLAQVHDAPLAGALAAFAHGRAARDVSARQVRGFTLDDVIAALPGVWSLEPTVMRPPVLADLPAVGEEQ